MREIGDYFEVVNRHKEIDRLIVRFVMSNDNGQWLLKNITDEQLDELFNVEFKKNIADCMFIEMGEEYFEFRLSKLNLGNDIAITNTKVTVMVDKSLKVFIR